MFVPVRRLKCVLVTKTNKSVQVLVNINGMYVGTMRNICRQDINILSYIYSSHPASNPCAQLKSQQSSQSDT